MAGYIGKSQGVVMLDISDGVVETADIQDGAVTAAKLAPGAAVPSQSGQSGKYLTTDGTTASWATVVQTAGMIHGFDVNPSTGVLTWTAGVTELYDGNFEPLNDAVIVGTDDMTFSVNAEGHLIMTIG
jgi:hypothetical protein